MASDSLFLTIDWGTQSVRVGLFDKEGRQVAMEKETYDPPYFSLHPNYAEQEAGRYFEYFAMASRRLAEKNGALFDRVVGATVSCFRDTAVLLDKDRKPLRPSILWLDQRMADCRKKLPFLSRLAFGLVDKSGSSIGRPHIESFRGSSIKIESSEPAPLEIDGEVVAGIVRSYEARVLPRAASIVVDPMSPYGSADDGTSRFGGSDVIAYPQ